MGDCREARKLMQALLDGDLVDRAALDAHLAGCRACRGEMARLRRAQEMIAVEVDVAPPDERLEDMTRRAMAELGRETAPVRRRWAVAWAALGAAAIVVAFWLGLAIGGQRARVQAAAAPPKIVERVVERKVPVVQTRVVERVVRVPVVRTKVVYRYRTRVVHDLAPAPKPAVTEAYDPPKVEYSQSMHLARVVDASTER